MVVTAADPRVGSRDSPGQRVRIDCHGSHGSHSACHGRADNTYDSDTAAVSEKAGPPKSKAW